MSEKQNGNLNENTQDSLRAEVPESEEGEKYSFLQETVKDEQVTGKTVWNSFCKTAGKGLVFGVAACIAFCALKPWADNMFGNTNSNTTVTIPKDEEEETPQNVAEDEGEETKVVYPDLTVEDYREMNQALFQVATAAGKSVAEVSIVREEASWENREFDTVNTVSGVIIWQNGAEVLVLAPARIAADTKNFNVKFIDNAEYAATLKRQDKNTGLAVISVEKSVLSDTTRNQIKTATLGNSNTLNRGNPVIVLGKQFGCSGGMGYGIISSIRNRVSVADGEYRILTTDIAAAEGGSGVLFNTDGEVVGIMDQNIGGQSGNNLVSGYAISEIKEYIELLSNGKGIPYLGIHGVEVTESLAQELGIPKGIYVKEVETDSPAMKAGIQIGDVIMEVDKSDVSTISGYTKQLMETTVGEEIKVSGQRRGASEYVDVDFAVIVGSKE